MSLVARQYNPIGDARGATEVGAALRRYVGEIGDAVTYVTGAVTLADADAVVAIAGFTGSITLTAGSGSKRVYQFIYASGSGTVTITDGTLSETMDAIGEVITVYDDPKTGLFVVVEDNRTVWGGEDVTIGNLSVTGTLGVTGATTLSADVALAYAGARLTLGDDTGSPQLRFAGADASVSNMQWLQDDFVAWQIQRAATTHHLAFRRFIDDAYQEDTLVLHNDTGATEINGALDHDGSTAGFFDATPVTQQATTGTTAGFTAGAGTAAKDDSTYTGNSGTAAYTVGDIVLALKNYGLLAVS